MYLINKIKKELVPKVKFGETIVYSSFLILYNSYKKVIPENIFATEYYKIKNNENVSASIDIYKTERSIIRHNLKESKMYTWEDFEYIAKMVDLDIEKIFILYFGENKIDIVQKYFYALKVNRQLFLGKLPLKNTSLLEEIVEFCQNYAKAVCINLRCRELTDDIADEAVTYVLENCGSYEINFGDEWWDFL